MMVLMSNINYFCSSKFWRKQERLDKTLAALRSGALFSSVNVPWVLLQLPVSSAAHHCSDGGKAAFQNSKPGWGFHLLFLPRRPRCLSVERTHQPHQLSSTRPASNQLFSAQLTFSASWLPFAVGEGTSVYMGGFISIAQGFLMVPATEHLFFSPENTLKKYFNNKWIL